ncbi:hypothetical protein I546_4928 [Mycobacterium kansasii 732]|nr:hypothetical protein I546_4928 [Mycobacterium kansasii 732]
MAGFAAVLNVPRATAGEPSPTPFVQVRIDKVTPDVVTTTSDPVVTVSGTVTNIGDRPVREVMVRLEHAAAVASSAALRTSLDGSTDQYQPAADFLTVAPELQRGQAAGFTLSAPLRSLTKPSLTIDQPGIFPILVNVNGTPDYGAPARLDNARFLLPVVGVPPDRAADFDSAVAPETAKPVWITMLWPLADRPRLAPGVPGGTIPVRLVDDDLANSLANGGRLDTLLSAAELATSRDVDPEGAVTRALCLAVDPDLLVTVNAMTAGYVVSDSSDGPGQLPGTPTHPGTGQTAATIWLNRLRTLAHRTCVAPLPYSQADLDALQRVNDAGLSTIATVSAADIVDKILDVNSVRGATLMPDGPLTNRAVDLLSAYNGMVTIAAADFSAPTPLKAAPPTPTSRRGGCPRNWLPRRSTRPSAPPWPRRAPTRALPPTWTLRCRSTSATTRPPPAARTPWARCCGAVCPRTPRRVPRSWCRRRRGTCRVTTRSPS